MKKPSKYNVASPTVRNRETNNYCISPEQIYNKKDFLFKFDNGKEVIVPNEKISEYQQTHPACWCKGFPVYDEDGVFKRYVSHVSYILIPKDFVLNFAG